MKTARIIITQDCPRNCSYCCNEHRSVRKRMGVLHSLDELKPYDEIIITGGEPLIRPDETLAMLEEIEASPWLSQKDIYLYTATFHPALRHVLKLVDGITYSLHVPFSASDRFRFDNVEALLVESKKKEGPFGYGNHRLNINAAINEQVCFNPDLWARVETQRWEKEMNLMAPPCPEKPGEDLLLWKGWIV